MRVTYGEGFALAPIKPMRERVERLLAEQESQPQIDCPIKHYFAPGIWAREMSIPAGSSVVGAIHKTENLIVVSMGRLHIITDEGTREVVAGETFTCKPGMQNAVAALEDSRWTNFFANPTNETDIDKLVEMVCESKACELMGGNQNRQLLANMNKQETLGGSVCL